MAEPIRVLVCGGRRFNDAELLGSWLGGIHKQRGISCLIEGGATGADRMARAFAKMERDRGRDFTRRVGKGGARSWPTP